MVKITLTGDIPSKKNGKRIVFSKRLKVPFIISSKNHQDWHKRVINQLLTAKPYKSQIKVVELIFFPSSRRKFDLSNKAESVMDILVDAKVLEDDN